jgi:hypothetical protein
MLKVKRRTVIPRNAVPVILGVRGDMIQHIDRQTNTRSHVHIEDARGDLPVVVTTRGDTLEAVLNGIARIQEIVEAAREFWVFPGATEQVHFEASTLFPWVFQDGVVDLDFAHGSRRLEQLFGLLPCMSIVFRDFEHVKGYWYNQAVVLRDIAYSIGVPVHQDFDSPVIVSKHPDTMYYPSFATVYVDLRIHGGVCSLLRHRLHGLLPFLPAAIPLVAYPVLPPVNDLPSRGYPLYLQPETECCSTWEETYAVHVPAYAQGNAARFLAKMLWCHHNQMLMV